MKKIQLLFFAFLFSFVSLCVEAATATVRYDDEEDLLADEEKARRILEKKLQVCGKRDKPLRILGLEEAPPWSWKEYQKNKNGRDILLLKGLDIEIIGEVIKRSKVPYISYSFIESPRAMTEFLVEKNKIDIAVGLNPSHDKDIKNHVLYPSYIGNPIVVVFAKGREKEVKTLQDLSGMKGLALRNDDILSFLYGLPEDVKIRNIATANLAFTRLLEHETDFLLMGYYTALVESKRYKIEDKVVIGTNVLAEARRFAFMKKTEEKKPDCTVFKDDFEKHLKELSKDTNFLRETLRKVYKEYEQLHKNDRPLSYLPPVSKIAKPPVAQPQTQDKPKGN